MSFSAADASKFPGPQPRLSSRGVLWLPRCVGVFRSHVRPRTRYPSIRVFAASLGVVLAGAWTDVWALGQTEPTQSGQLSGQWTASALAEVWVFPAWPAACGPKPSPQVSSGGVSTVEESAGELTFAGLDRPFRTNQCWEQYPGLRRVAHSRSARAWSNTCKSADTDPRQANIHTSLSAFGETLIKFRETGSFEFHLDGARCTAQVTRTRSFSRSASREVNTAETPAALAGEVVNADDDAAAAAAAGAAGGGPTAAVAGVAPTAPSASSAASAAGSELARLDGADAPSPPSERPVRHDCTPSGPATEIRVPRPVHWLQTGSTFRLMPALVDASGCAVAKGPFNYTVEPDTGAVSVGLKSGLIQVSPQAPEGKYSVIIRSGQLREVIEVPVVTREGLAAFLQAPTDAPLAVSAGSPNVPLEMIGVTPAAASDHATPRKWWFIGLTAAVTLGLGGLGLRLLRAGSRPTMPPPAPKQRQPLAKGAGATPSVEVPDSVVQHSDFRHSDAASTLPRPPAEAEFADVPPPAAASSPTKSQPRSNPPPKPNSRGAREPATGAAKLRACPQCGRQYTDGSVFCGVDGDRLVDAPESALEKR